MWENEKQTRNESDSAWKDVLDVFFKQFLKYCLPELAKQIDWQKPYVSLDKELQAITKGTEAGKRLLDKLFKVYLINGQEQWVLLHVEVQGAMDEDFPKRMFIYGYRIFDKYQKPVVSCAIFTDENKTWCPNHYEIGLAGSCLRSNFLTVKLIDYKDKKDELEASQNPFASVILSQLAALESKSKPADIRKNVKFNLTKRLYEKGFGKQEISNLYKFIDWLIGLPRPFEVEYLNSIYELEESKKMAYITSAEKFGIEKGIEKGKAEGIEEIAIRLLHRHEKDDAILEITQLTPQKLANLKKKIQN